jgi:hypothetical protein
MDRDNGLECKKVFVTQDSTHLTLIFLEFFTSNILEIHSIPFHTISYPQFALDIFLMKPTENSDDYESN